MTSSTTFIRTLSEALGLPHGGVDWTARALREGGLFPVGKGGRGGAGAAEVTAEHATSLLLALMAPPSPRSVPVRVNLFSNLPLARITPGELTPDGSIEMVDIADPSPLMRDFRGLGDTFGEFLATFVKSSAADPDFFVQPGEIMIGGGPGTATGAIALHIHNQVDIVTGFAKFTMTPLGAGYFPDDAPRARLDCHFTVPTSIFTVFGELFADSPEIRCLRPRTAPASARARVVGEVT